MFLKYAWYVAAWSDEVTGELKQIRVLGEKICIFRTSGGEVIALEDACPHRKLPLSKGRIRDDNVECGYHGLTFDCAGQCVWAPGGGRIPSNAKVRAYPVHEQYGLVWIWMGNPDSALHNVAGGRNCLQIPRSSCKRVRVQHPSSNARQSHRLPSL